MRYFFIDLENVRNEGLEGVLSLNEKDMVYIFYSENAFSMAIPTMESITNSKCSSKFIKTNYIGKNAMDFQIVSLFGAMIERCREGSFYIISKDNGFRSAVSFCESFFSDYPIKCGVYPRIISALAVEGKGNKENNKTKGGAKTNANTNTKANANANTNTNENVNVNANVNVNVNESPDTEEKKSKSRRSRRKSKNNSDKSADKKQDNTPDNAQESAPEKAPGQGSRENAQQPAEKPAEQPAENRSAGKLEYIFDLLREYLSERTIEIYAGCIDEGIAKTNSREELQKFFWENLGEDEGEALFKVVRSDYEKYKQNRPKKTSRPRRRRGRSSQNPDETKSKNENR